MVALKISNYISLFQLLISIVGFIFVVRQLNQSGLLRGARCRAGGGDGAAYYALKAAAAADPEGAAAAIAKKLEWQAARLPAALRKGWGKGQRGRLPKALKPAWEQFVASHPQDFQVTEAG